MTLSKIIRLLRRHRPSSYADFRACTGADLFESGVGCFRHIFRIAGFKAVVKFPLENCGVAHSRREIRRLRQIKRRKTLRHLVRYAPKVFYEDYTNGILVMEYLTVVGKNGSRNSAPDGMQTTIGTMLEDTFSCISNDSDAKYCNLGYDGRGQIKVLDWGCV